VEGGGSLNLAIYFPEMAGKRRDILICVAILVPGTRRGGGRSSLALDPKRSSDVGRTKQAVPIVGRVAFSETLRENFVGIVARERGVSRAPG
jgi:hypothetical protein